MAYVINAWKMLIGKYEGKRLHKLRSEDVNLIHLAQNGIK